MKCRLFFMVLRPASTAPVIVVLGAGLGSGGIGFASRLRATAAAVLYSRHGGIVIMSGGHTAGREGKSEAETMKEYVVRRWRYHVPEENVLNENTSLSTPENVVNVCAMLKKRGLTNSPILLVAGRRNRLQAADYFRAAGFTVRPYTVRQVLLRYPSFTIPRTFEPKLSRIDRQRNLLFRVLRYIDPKGHLAARIGRWRRVE